MREKTPTNKTRKMTNHTHNKQGHTGSSNRNTNNTRTRNEHAYGTPDCERKTIPQIYIQILRIVQYTRRIESSIEQPQHQAQHSNTHKTNQLNILHVFKTS